MIDIDFKNETYVCPYCGCKQSYSGSSERTEIGYRIKWHPRSSEAQAKDLIIYHLKCTNEKCQRITVVGKNRASGQQIDIYPKVVVKTFPDYVPEAIRNDYREAVVIMSDSPKASAALLRRCLQGMIRDYWKIKGSSLKNEIDNLEGKVSPSQWKAIDGLRRIGNIGAHMEKDINLIIDIDEGEAQKLASLIEILIKDWYISRHENEELYNSIVKSADSKK